MPATKSQGSLLKMESSRAAAKTITGITAADPPVVTSSAHGYANGDIVLITGVVGMVEVNDRVFQVANQATNTFELKGVKGAAYTAYGSGGSAYKLTMTEIGRISDFDGFDGTSDEIDTTHLRSTAKEYLIGLQDFGNAQMTLQYVGTDAGQTLLRDAKAAAALKGFSLTISDATTATFAALVKSFPISIGGPNNIITSQVALRLSGEPGWFA